MPVIKVWCLPREHEKDLRRLHQAIVWAVTSVSELGLWDQNDMTCLFPSDLMSYGLGEEIIVEISGLFVKPERTQEVRQHLARVVGFTIKAFYPNARIECFVTSFEPAQGFWSSANINTDPATPLVCEIRCDICGQLVLPGENICVNGHQI